MSELLLSLLMLLLSFFEFFFVDSYAKMIPCCRFNWWRLIWKCEKVNRILNWHHTNFAFPLILRLFFVISFVIVKYTHTKKMSTAFSSIYGELINVAKIWLAVEYGKFFISIKIHLMWLLRAHHIENYFIIFGFKRFHLKANDCTLGSFGDRGYTPIQYTYIQRWEMRWGECTIIKNAFTFVWKFRLILSVYFSYLLIILS